MAHQASRVWGDAANDDGQVRDVGVEKVRSNRYRAKGNKVEGLGRAREASQH